MKIHRIVNPIAYENTYLLENEDYLLVVDPGSAWEQIREPHRSTRKTNCCYSPHPYPLRPYHEFREGTGNLWPSTCLCRCS